MSITLCMNTLNEVSNIRAVFNCVADIVDDINNEVILKTVKSSVIALCQRFPVYGSE